MQIVELNNYYKTTYCTTKLINLQLYPTTIPHNLRPQPIVSLGFVKV